MRTALGIALLTAIGIYWMILAFEWLVRLNEPTEAQRDSLKTHWLLWQSGIVRREK